MQIGGVVVGRVCFKHVESALVALKRFLEQRPSKSYTSHREHSNTLERNAQESHQTTIDSFLHLRWDVWRHSYLMNAHLTMVTTFTLELFQLLWPHTMCQTSNHSHFVRSIYFGVIWCN